MPAEIYDVIQIGYGPVSQSLAQMLGQQGRSVAVVERWQERYPLPRAVCIDHELYRVLSANGMGKLWQVWPSRVRSINGSTRTGRNCSASPGAHNPFRVARK